MVMEQTLAHDPQSFWLRALRNPVSLTLIRRQLQTLLRHPGAYLLLCGSLILVVCGYLASYNSLAQRVYSPEDIGLVGLHLLTIYSQFSLLAIALVAPVAGVHAISKERDGGTLDLLLTTPIHPFEFILSKIIASFVILTAIIAGTAPVLVACIIMGGASPSDVGALIFFQFYTATVGLLIGIVMGAWFTSFTQGVTATYAILVAILTPIFSMANLIPLDWLPIRPLLFQAASSSFSGIVLTSDIGLRLFVFGLFILLILSSVPNSLSREINKVKPKSWRPLRMKGLFDAQLWTLLGYREYGDPLPDRGNPIYITERERFLAATARRSFDAPGLLWLLSALLFMTALHPSLFLQLSMFVVLIFVPLVGATAFAKEFQEKSWESLRASLVTNKQILRGKLLLIAGQGWIQTIAFYLPAPLVLAIIWYMAASQQKGGVYLFQTWNLLPIWVGHALNFPVLALTVLFIAAMSMWISSLFRNAYPALLTTYGATAFYLFAPWYFKLIHPAPGITLGGDHPLDAFSIILGVWHAPYAFNLWPTPTRNQAELAAIHEGFWIFYGAHVSLLIAGTVLCILATRRRIEAMDR